MDYLRSHHFRENSPMFGVCAILIVAFAALAIVGPARADQTLQVIQIFCRHNRLDRRFLGSRSGHQHMLFGSSVGIADIDLQ